MSAPTVPNIQLRPRVASGQARFYWAPPTSNGGSPVLYYTLAEAASAYSQALSSSVANFVVSSLSTAVNYTFTLTATNANGTSPAATFRTIQTGIRPFGPTSTVGSTLNLSTALVQWNLSTIPGEGGPRWFLVTAVPSTTTVSSVKKSAYIYERARTFPIPSTGVGYQYLVQAINDTGYCAPFAYTSSFSFTPFTAFSPSSIERIGLWLDAADPTTITRTDNSVSQWNDKSGFGYNLTQTNSVAQPQMSDSNYIRFNLGRHFDIPQTAMNNVSRYTMLFQFIPVSTTNYILGKQYDGINTYTVLSMTSTVNTGGGVAAGPTPGAMHWRTSNNGPNMSTTSSILFLGSSITMSLDFDGTSANFYRFGSSFGTNSNSGFVLANASTVTNFKMGMWFSPATTVGFPPSSISHFQMGEFIFYNNFITPFDRQKTEGYLAWKWGSQSNLPTTHPFRPAAPTAASVFSPSSLTGLQMWYDASDPYGNSIPIANNTAISSLIDKSGQSNHMFQPTVARRPVYQSNALNGNGVLSFSNTLFSTNHTAMSTCTRVIIYSNTTSITGQACIASYPSSFNLLLQQGGGGTYQDGIGVGGNTGFPSAFATGNTYRMSGTQIQKGNSNNNFVFVDGSNLANPGSVKEPDTSFSTFTSTIIGSRGDVNFVGNIAEVLVFNTILTEDNRRTVEGYLAWKWGLQGNLSTIHPYKYRNPAIIYTTSTIIPDGLAVNFTARNYSGSGTWSNLGAYGTNFNATVENGTPSLNAASNGVVFNGSTNFTFSNVAIGGSPWTASLWVKRTGSNDAGACYLTQIHNDQNINLTVYTNFTTGDGGNAGSNQVSVGFYNVSYGWKSPTAITLNLNTWTHLTYTWDGTTIRAFLNGASNSLLTPSVSVTANNSNYRIGRRWDFGILPNYIRGEVGQVLIYNRAITAAEVLQNYNATSSVYTV